MKKSNTKRALLSAALAMVLCIAMLVGTTFAWFTDSVTSAGNIIKSGTLEVGMYWSDGSLAVPTDNAGWTDASTGAIFDYDKWEPGYVQARHIKIANEGSLALKYKVLVEADGEVSDLTDVIDVYYVDPAVQIADRTALSADKRIGTLTEVLAALASTGSGVLTAGEMDTITIAFKMQETAGNEYQDKSIGASFAIKLYATQYESENDSFDNQYDVGAGLPVFSNSATANSAGSNSDVELKTDDMKVRVPGSLVDTLGEENTEEFYLIHTEPRAVGDAVILDSVELYDQNGNVIDLSNNTEPITVALHVGDFFAENDRVKIYHDNVEIATLIVDANGYVTYQAMHFCEVTVVYDPAVTITRGGVAYGYPSLQDAIDSAVNGDVLVMKSGTNTTDEPLTETILINKDISLDPAGMYLVSVAPATFTVVEGGKLTVLSGSFTIRNNATNGAAVLVDGGEFVMAGGSFHAAVAMKTTEGKSSTVTLAAGWSNQVVNGIVSNGNDTINVTGGTLISSKQSILAYGTTTINMSGGTLSGKSTSTYGASVDCKGATTINMTGGKIESTNGESIAISAYNNSEINISGDAVVAGAFSAVNTGGGMRPQGDNNVINIFGNAKVSASGAGNSFGIGYAVYACSSNTAVSVFGNAQITGTSYGVYAGQTGSSITVADAAVIKATTGRNSGYGVGAATITVTGGTIEAREYGVISNFATSVVVIDNSTTGTPITISGGIQGVLVSDTAEYTLAGNPVIKP